MTKEMFDRLITERLAVIRGSRVYLTEKGETVRANLRAKLNGEKSA